MSSVPEVLKLHVVGWAELTGLDDAVKLAVVLVLKSHRCFPLQISDTFERLPWMVNSIQNGLL